MPISLQNVKTVLMRAAKTLATNATDTGIADCQSWHYAKVQLHQGVASSGTSNTFTTLKLRAGDTTSVTSHTDISGCVGGTDFTIPVVNSSTTGAIVEFNVDLRKMNKRYISIYATPAIVASDMGPFSVVAYLGRAEVSPTSAAEAINLVNTTGAGTTHTTYARVIV